MGKRRAKFTFQEMVFCERVASGSTYVNAVYEAYKYTNANTARNKAWRLMSKPEIVEKIEKLKEKYSSRCYEKTVNTLLKALEKLELTIAEADAKLLPQLCKALDPVVNRLTEITKGMKEPDRIEKKDEKSLKLPAIPAHLISDKPKELIENCENAEIESEIPPQTHEDGSD